MDQSPIVDVKLVEEADERIFMQFDKQFTMMESCISLESEDRVGIEKWIELQQKLKEEKYRMYQEHQIKQSLQEELNKESEAYYQMYINVLEESNPNGERKLFTQISKLFGNASTYVIEIFQNMVNNPLLCSAVLQHHNNIIISTSIHSLINTIVNSLYDNVACASMWNQPIIRLMSEMIANEVNTHASPDFRWDSEQSLAKFMLGEFTKRPENIKYTKVIYKSTILAITKVDKYLDLDRIKISDKLREIKKRNVKEREEKHFQTLRPQSMQPSHMSRSATTATKPSAPLFQPQTKQQIELPKLNMAEYYASLIKQFDTNQKFGRKETRKNAFQLTEPSLKLLVFQEEQKQAKFVSLERRNVTPEVTQSPVKRLSDVYNHSSRSEVQMNNDVIKVLTGCIEKLKQLVNDLLGNVFKNIYTLPVGLRIICKLIQISLLRKFPNATELQIQDNIFSFLFNVWLIPQLTFPRQYSSFKFIREEHEQAIQQIHQILRKMIRRQNYDDDPVYAKLNAYIQDLQPSLRDYLREILNICPKSIQGILENNQVLDAPASNCVCIALADVKTLCLLLKELANFKSENAELQQLVTRLNKRASATLQIAEDDKIFGGRSDLQQGITYQPQQIYALILEFKLPPELVKDYTKFVNPLKKLKIVDEQERQRLKLVNALHQVLSEVQDLSVSPACSQEDASLRRVINYFEEKYAILGDKTILYHLQYMNGLIMQMTPQMGASNLKEYYDVISGEFEERFSQESEIITETKFQLLKAKFNIHKNYEEMKESHDQLTQERRQKQLYEFIEKTPLQFCVTSPKTREGLYSVKAMKMRNNATQEEDKIWVEDQKECIHNAINLEFIKQIVGGGATSPNDSKKNSEFSNSHCGDIKAFVDIFAKLPEVRDAVMTGQDRAGVKQAYFEFVKAMAEYLKEKENMMLDDEQIMDMLEKYVSKRIYDIVYPKERTYKDAGLYLRIKSLDWINYDHLDISKNNRVDEMWMLAADALNQMDNCKTAVSKQESMIQCTKIMTDVLKLTSLKDEATSADTTLPIMIYILLKATPQRLYSNLNFVRLFMDERKMVGQQGYCLTQLELAINWIERVEHNGLKMDQLRFMELITKSEIRSGVHYIKKRNRSERITNSHNRIAAIINS